MNPGLPSPNAYLVTAAGLSILTAALHLGIILFGAPWYRFFGAGRRMVRMAEAGDWRTAAITLCIALVLAIWALYGLSGAGVLPRLPLLKLSLCLITAAYLGRGLIIVPISLFARDRVTPFWLWSSGLCLIYGALHLTGLVQTWGSL